MKWLFLPLLFLGFSAPAQAESNVEPELCFQKIQAAYKRSETSAGQFRVDETCLKYKAYYDMTFRGIPLKHPRIVFIGTALDGAGQDRQAATTFSVAYVYEGPDVETITIHHALENFEFFPGEHVIEAYRNQAGDFVNKGLSDGEVITYSERQRRAQMKAFYEHRESRGPNPRKESCFYKIKQAYDAELISGKWTFDDEICGMFKDEYDTKFRREIPKE